MIYLLQFVICIIFIELFFLLRLSNTIKSTFSLSRRAFDVISSKELGDEQKEVLIRQASLQMLKVTFLFIAKFLAIALGLYLVYLLLAAILPHSEAEFVASLYSINVIIALTLVAFIYVRLRNVIIQRLQSR